MKVAYVSLGSPHSKRSWGGIPFHALRELSRLDWTLEVIDTPRLDAFLTLASRLAWWGALPVREPLVTRYFDRRIEAALRAIDPDAIIAVNADHKIARAVDRWPTVVFNDGFFGPMSDFYPKYARLRRRVMANGEAQQRRILASDASVVVSSDWAARSAADYYKVPRSRFVIAPMGPNFDVTPPPAPARGPAGPLKLLFVGYDWARKGGPIVAEAFRLIRRAHPDAALDIVGCHPWETRGLAGVTHHGRLNKSDPGHRALLDALYAGASFFFMPSRQECSAVVYCEACAHSLPPVGADTGGTATIIEPGVNGLLLPLAAGGEDHARAILAAWADGPRYRSMRLAARRAFETRLNWRAWALAIEAEIRRLTRARRHGQDRDAVQAFGRGKIAED
jgi:glycosyltransferase involved in cell wall biosynthesis